MSMPSRWFPAITAALAAVSASFPPSLTGQSTMPRLVYSPPAELYHSALRPPEIYESSQVNASMQVYLFRQAPPDVVDRFHKTMLRDWIAPQYQETQLVGPPAFGVGSVVGADAVHYSQFAEAVSPGVMPRPRLRFLIVARGSAALLDAQAQSLQAWNVAYPSFQALLSTLRVDTGGRVIPGTGATAATRTFAGLYVGVKPKFQSTIGPGIGAGSGGFVRAKHMYLFSDDGLVYRAYDDIRVPGGDTRRFDFDGAAVADPVNSGSYAIEGNQLVLHMGERLDETLIVPLQQPGRVTIETVEYFRQGSAR